MTTNKSILIIDDDKVIRDTLGFILQEEGYSTTLAANGQEGLDLLANAERLPDVILLDIMMPVLNGIQFRQEQLNKPDIKRIPTIIMSADHSVHKNCASLGCKHVLKKPIDLDELLAILESHEIS